MPVGLNSSHFDQLCFLKMFVETALVLACVAGSVLQIAAEEQELIFVTFVHRHGDRSPVGTYPTDPYGNESLWNNGWGQLTNTGKRNTYSLGKWLRKRYSNFIPEIYDKNDYEVWSTDVDRTLMSAYLVAAGLYEPSGRDVWNPEVNWQPVPVRATPRISDHVLAASKPCLRHSQLLASLFSSEEISNRLRGFGPAMSDIVRRAGFNSNGLVSDFLTTAMVFDSLNVQNDNGFRLPDWTRNYFPEPMKEISSLFLRLPAYTRPLQRLYCGSLVKEISQHFKLKSKGFLKKKMWHYSAHDITIAGLRQCLGLNETESPPYNSALILELRVQYQQYYVKTLYKTANEIKTVTLLGCPENCPLEQFEDLMKPIIPEDWEAECEPA